MEIENGLDGLLGKTEPHATFRDARLVAVSVDYRSNEAISDVRRCCVGDPDDSMRAARERRRTGRLILSGVAFWVIDPPGALDARPGLPWRPAAGPCRSYRRKSARSWLASCPKERRAGTLLRRWNAHMYGGARRLTSSSGCSGGERPRIDRAAARL